jgi:hypothetical protein
MVAAFYIDEASGIKSKMVRDPSKYHNIIRIGLPPFVLM